MNHSQLKSVLVNPAEHKADQLLQQIGDQFGDRLLAKVRLADVIEPTWAALSESESGFATRSHLDFVMVNPDTSLPVFAVEIDGMTHTTDDKQRWRDSVKDKLCDEAGLPLIRVNSNFGKSGGRYVLLKYLCEIFYRARGFDEAQARGDIREDEPFIHFLFLDQVPGGGLMFGAFDAAARISLLNLWRAKRVPRYVPDSWHGTKDLSGNVRSEVYLSLGTDRVIVAGAQVRHFHNFGISPGELAEEIATVELVTHVERWLAGEAVALSADSFRRHFRSFVAECNPYSTGAAGTPGTSDQEIPYPAFKTGPHLSVLFD